MRDNTRQYGLNSLKDFSNQELRLAYECAERAYSDLHEQISNNWTSPGGDYPYGLHRKLNALARERRLFWMAMKRRKFATEIDHRQLRQIGIGEYLASQAGLGLTEWPHWLMDSLFVWTQASGGDSRVMTYYGNGGKVRLRILSDEGVEQFLDWHEKQQSLPEGLRSPKCQTPKS